MRRIVLFAVVAAAFGALSSQVSAVERHVPVPYATIQAAINDCNDGDVVIIAEGTYTGAGNRNIDFLGKAITVRSLDPEDPCVVAATVINCEGSQSDPHRGFWFHSGEDGNSVLSGLTITNGYVYDANGGGVSCEGASPTIEYCLIKDCKAYGIDKYYGGYGNGGHGYGGGIFCTSGSSPIIRYCTISNNSAVGGRGAGTWDYSTGPSGDGFGGGISCNLGSNPSVVSCLIRDNTASGNDGVSFVWWEIFRGSNGHGGGIYTDSSSSPVIFDCSVMNNKAIGGNGKEGSLDYEVTSGGHGYGGGYALSHLLP